MRACLLLTALLVPLVPVQAATLTVTIANIRTARGHVRIGVCEKAQFLSERCTYHAIVSAKPGSVVAVIPDVQAGTYAVAAYQDETDSGHLRRGLFGIPKEGSGFSRDPSPGMGPPSFGQCAIGVGTGDVSVTVTLRYF